VRIGCCIDARSPVVPRQLDALGASAVSVRLAPSGERTQQLHDLAAIRDSGRDILGVIDASSFTSPLDWRGGLDVVLDYLVDLVDHQLITQVAVGREWDDGVTDDLLDDPLVKPRGGYGSWVLSAADLAEMLDRVDARLGVPRPVPLLLGGICSGHAAVLRTLDLSRVDGVCVHPYGSGVDTAGDDVLNHHLDAVVAEIDAQGRTGQVGVLIGELGRSDLEVSREVIADWFARTLQQLEDRGDIDAVFIYTDADRSTAGYGQFDQLGQPKPSVPVLAAITETLDTGGPLVGTPGDADEDPDDDILSEPDAGWMDEQLTPAGIARALSGATEPEMIEAVETLWGHLWPWFEHYGLTDDLSAKITLLAAIWVQTDGWLSPQIEAGSYDRLERLYGRESRSGLALGNRYHGDGYRYRGRGFASLRGRAAYANYGPLLDLPLEDEPDLLTDPTVAAGALVMLFVHHELFETAHRGDLFTFWSALSPGRNGYASFAQAVVSLWTHGSDGAARGVESSGEDEAMWQERYEAAIEQAEALAETLYAQQRKLEALGEPPAMPSEKETKKVWVESGKTTRRWQEHAHAVVSDSADVLGGLADALIKIGLDRPTEQEAGDGGEEEEQQQQQEQEQ
jgi:hypothetical protein